ncbi:FlaA1/EpsC-like NDP-sugar epimerase [Catenibacillus scindens]|uniref:FlaA1/EpsC-like NDP-sugar epimerase n=1 Tax=Catenibacillus scindens TaxID=673271 RepID=A0A7W8HBT5_9FIRM|nr:nucleoside-diphosphate sugar epimerase/dehydratase [Catenibacillus scindens]MBB5265395.1 FlaA1/EpsC-like NDP-sugar epimerase [Catenibacillus scindens]
MKKKMVIIIADILAVVLSYGAALWLRFDLHMTAIPGQYLRGYGLYIPLSVAVLLIVYTIFRLYKSIWIYAGLSELIRTFFASLITAALSGIVSAVLLIRMPMGFYLMGWVFLFLLTAFIRISYRLFRRMTHQHQAGKEQKHPKNVMIIGAGAAGRTLLREYTTSQYVTEAVRCFIDDNSDKWGRYLEGVPIVGGRDKIQAMAAKYDIQKIILAIPGLKPLEKKEILDICKYTGCQVQTVPGIYQLINGEVSVSQLRDVDVEDLLGREPIKMNIEDVLGYVKGQVVLVTGGGGSIGSELCRQLAAHQVKQLIILEMYENNAYDIQQELKYKYPDLNLTVLIGSVRNSNRLEDIFKTYHPDIVYHAAAHKHVPLMEDSPNEAIKNNVIGTYKTAMRADKYHTRRFVLISTDKAVNPTNIMGASKRLCEMVIQMFAQKSETIFTAVRFGNVLGSNGSVIPLFKKQIAHGGPVTVTHPDIIRYFMTIPEAVSLVLQAGAYAKGGEIFVLDMGQPVKIADLARNLIRLSGLTPDVDIKIEYTGLRPGEKLYEELLMAEEGLKKTANQRIFIGNPLPVDGEKFRSQLAMLDKEAWDECTNMKGLVQSIVPEYHPKDA